MPRPQPAAPKRTAFLLAQLGSLSAARFGERTKVLGLTPSEAGVIRLLGRSPGLSQRAVAERIRTAPSRVVALIDSLGKRGLVRRNRSTTDRRNIELRLTEDGQEILRRLRTVAAAHEADILAPLTTEQSDELTALLETLCAGLGLDDQVHRETTGR